MILFSFPFALLMFYVFFSLSRLYAQQWPLTLTLISQKYFFLNFKRNEFMRRKLLQKIFNRIEMDMWEEMKENNCLKLFETQSAFPLGLVAQWWVNGEFWDKSFLELIIPRRLSWILQSNFERFAKIISLIPFIILNLLRPSAEEWREETEHKTHCASLIPLDLEN